MKRLNVLIVIFGMLFVLKVVVNRYGFFHSDDSVDVGVENMGIISIDYNAFTAYGWNEYPFRLDSCEVPPNWYENHLWPYKPDVYQRNIYLLKFSWRNGGGVDLEKVYAELSRRGWRSLECVELLGLARERSYLFESKGCVFALSEIWTSSHWHSRGFPVMQKSVHKLSPSETYRPGFRYNISLEYPFQGIFSKDDMIAATPNDN